MPETETQYEEVRLEKVRRLAKGWEVQRSDGWWFYVPAEYGVEPRAGMLARVYSNGIGFPIRGLDLDGQRVFYEDAALSETEG
jgi:hypothetical protein